MEPVPTVLATSDANEWYSVFYMNDYYVLCYAFSTTAGQVYRIKFTMLMLPYTHSIILNAVEHMRCVSEFMIFIIPVIYLHTIFIITIIKITYEYIL